MKFCVALDSAGCTADTCINIGLSAINPTITSSSPSVCASAHFTLSASGGSGTNYTFLAPLGSAPPSMTVVGNTAIHSSTLAPSLLTYTIVADSLGCKAEVLFTQTVNLCITSLREETANRDFSIYPNPVQHNFTLETGFPGIITVTDITGRIIIEKEVTERKTLFNSESLSPGLYSVSYKTSTHLFSTKIVK
jgi:hypothetical protein